MYSEVKLTCYYITTVYKGVGKGGGGGWELKPLRF